MEKKFEFSIPAREASRKVKIPAIQESNPGREDQLLEVETTKMLADCYSQSSSSRSEKCTIISQCAIGGLCKVYKYKRRLLSCKGWISTFYLAGSKPNSGGG